MAYTPLIGDSLIPDVLATYKWLIIRGLNFNDIITDHPDIHLTVKCEYFNIMYTSTIHTMCIIKIPTNNAKKTVYAVFKYIYTTHVIHLYTGYLKIPNKFFFQITI